MSTNDIYRYARVLCVEEHATATDGCLIKITLQCKDAIEHLFIHYKNEVINGKDYMLPLIPLPYGKHKEIKWFRASTTAKRFDFFTEEEFSINGRSSDQVQILYYDQIAKVQPLLDDRWRIQTFIDRLRIKCNILDDNQKASVAYALTNKE